MGPLPSAAKSSSRSSRRFIWRQRSAQVYPPLLVRGILEALRNQLAEDGEFSQALNSLGGGPVPDAAPVIDEEQEVFDHLPSADVIVTGPVYDTNTGAELDLEKVATARKEELEWVQRQRTIFYEPDPRHAEILLKDLNEKLTAEALAKRMELDVVDPHRISQYRSLTMRAAWGEF
ncbi:Putative mitochondrial protein [Durusdinium trenchii]|uniref:Mitochondrial protein n=1 Tax=Durusdinium trenchii TaxID=1381693 RepID=A0ABP0KQK3_9DINO